MPNDAYHFSIITRELSAQLPCRIDRVGLSGAALLLSLYNGKSHTLNIEAQNHGTLYLTQKGAAFGSDNSAFFVSLKKLLTNAILTSAKIERMERIISLSITAKDDLGYPKELTLIAELMGKFSNIYLVDSEQKIIAAEKSTALDLDSKRPHFLGGSYIAPPRNVKVDISIDDNLSRLLEGFKGGNLARYLFDSAKGFAYTTLEAIILSIFNKTEFEAFSSSDAEVLREKLPEFFDFDKLKIAPCVVLKEGKPIDFFCFAVGENQPKSTLSEAAASFYSDINIRGKRETLRSNYLVLLNREIKKTEKSAQLFAERISEANASEKNKIFAELLTANIYQLKTGLSKATLPNYYLEDSPNIDISLDPLLSPAQNAQRYYKKYNKQKRSLAINEQYFAENQTTLAYLKELLQSLSLAETFEEIDDLTDELTNLGLIKAAKTGKKAVTVSMPYHEIIEGYHIYVGKNNLQNDKLTKEAAGGDLWLHVQGFHGSHVIIRGSNPPQHIILKAAEFAAYQSKARSAQKVPVDCTFVKFVKKPKGSPPGKVIYSNQKTYYVTPKKL